MQPEEAKEEDEDQDIDLEDISISLLSIPDEPTARKNLHFNPKSCQELFIRNIMTVACEPEREDSEIQTLIESVRERSKSVAVELPVALSVHEEVKEE